MELVHSQHKSIQKEMKSKIKQNFNAILVLVSFWMSTPRFDVNESLTSNQGVNDT